LKISEFFYTSFNNSSNIDSGTCTATTSPRTVTIPLARIHSSIDAYQRRDRVGLIVFQKDRATLVLPPTNSVQLAQRALMDIPVGGKTPLSAGLFLAADVLRQEKLHHPDIEPLLIVLTDGAGNVSIGALPPQEESYRFAELIAHEKVKSVVINMEHAAFDQGLAQQLANHLKAPCYALSELKAESLYHTVKEEMAKPMKK